MSLQPDAAYLALRSRDARFDGRLFVGVTSTGIYCRPVCRVRTPRADHCRYFGSAPAAEQAGFRPCLRCRPEQAPGLSRIDSPQALAHEAARLLDAAAHRGEALALTALAGRLGVTDRHLRRIFQAAHGVAPRDYLHTRRLLLAKQLLTETRLSVGEVALASGYASARRLHAEFAARYRLSPSALRGARAVPPAGDALVLHLGYRPPYDMDGVLRFLRARAIDGVEAVQGHTWLRTLAVGDRAGWLSVTFEPERDRVRITLSPALAPSCGQVLQRVRQALDLDAEPALIDPVLAAHLPCPAVPGVRLPGAIDGFETAVRVILGQQVTVAAARTLAARLVERFGTPVDSPSPALRRLFPDAAALALAPAEEIGRLGIVRQRVGALQALAREVQAGRLVLDPSALLGPTLAALQALPGLGDWSVQLIAMRALGWPDAFPASDIGLLNALGHRDVAAARAIAEAWRPWRGYAVIRLWQTLEAPERALPRPPSIDTAGRAAKAGPPLPQETRP